MMTITPVPIGPSLLPTEADLSLDLPLRGCKTLGPAVDVARSVGPSWVKRLVDLVGAGLGLVALLPLLGVLAILVRIDSRGPILFRQIRLGRDGREFFCLKFRTMTPDAEARLSDLENLNESQGGVLFKIKADPRVTRLGRFLRRSSLDELPQLWNVFRGDMSLVGPRPLQVRDCRKLIAVDPVGFARRLSVLPGVTGPWQVGGRSDVDGERMMDLDLDYVEHHPLTTDLKILARTLVVVLRGRGAC